MGKALQRVPVTGWFCGEAAGVECGQIAVEQKAQFSYIRY
jgi:hypothetical protein